MKFAIIFIAILCNLTCCVSKSNEGDAEVNDIRINDIVIVNIGTTDRVGLSKQLDFINSLNPKVIAIDVQFSNDHNFYHDSLLIASLNRCKNLVMAIKLRRTTTFPYKFDGVEGTLPKFYANARIGFVNIILNDLKDPLTAFSLYEKVNDDIFYHFAIQASFAYDSSKTINFLRTNPKNVDIKYVGNKEVFDVFSLDDALSQSIPATAIEGKVVLLGYTGPYEGFKGQIDEDMFFTPLSDQKVNPYPDMYGVVYLANLINQILAPAPI